MLNFSEYYEDYIEEAVAKAKAEKVVKPENDFGSLSADSKGKLHEILVGYHLRGGKHMEKHEDVEGKSPKQVHDETTTKLGGTKSRAYKNFSERSRKAAEHLKQELGLKSEDISNVQWTSKAGDIHRATGIHSTQKEDDSDVVITDKKGKHYGISLKVSDKNEPITLSNAGVESTYGGDKLLKAHRDAILKKYPAITKLTNAEQRKTWLKSNPKAETDIKQRNVDVLQRIAGHAHNEISKLTPEQKAHHVRHIVLHAFSTPMEAQGHIHRRHFTGGLSNAAMEMSHPGVDHEHILNDPKNITLRHSGTSVYYEHKGVPFAMHTIKFSSQSDPLSSIVGVGKEVVRKKDAAAREAAKQKTTVTDQAPVKPEHEITSHDIVTGHPSLTKKKLSDYRQPRTRETFAGFMKSKAEQTNSQQVSPFSTKPKPGFGDHRQSVDGTHGGFVFRSTGE